MDWTRLTVNKDILECKNIGIFVGNKAEGWISKRVFQKKTKHVKFSKKRTFFTPWYARVCLIRTRFPPWYVRVRIRGWKMFVFRKIWRALFSLVLRFALLHYYQRINQTKFKNHSYDMMLRPSIFRVCRKSLRARYACYVFMYFFFFGVVKIIFWNNGGIAKLVQNIQFLVFCPFGNIFERLDLIGT